MTKHRTTKLATRLIATALCSAPLLASAGSTVVEPIIPAQAPANSWEFRITPYAWLTALSGTTGPDGKTADIDSSFGDIADVLKMAAAVQMEARNGKWGFLVDGFYADLGTSGTTSGPLQLDVDMDLKQFIGEFEVLYRLSETPDSYLDVYAGGRYSKMKLSIDVTGDKYRSSEPSKDWTDPIVGLRGQWNINDKWYLSGKGDIGGFGVGSDFTWMLQANLGYQFNDCFSTELGYRYLDTDYDNKGFVYDMDQNGLVIGFNFEF